MHIYAFGSITRGDVTHDSDVDLLALVDGPDSRFDPDRYSVYTYTRIRELWQQGNPFAWHLALEAVQIHSSTNSDFLKLLGQPERYTAGIEDCEKFLNIFKDASAALSSGAGSRVFEMSVIFLAVRNIATCFSLAATPSPSFARHAALRIRRPLQIESAAYETLSHSRTLSTRGKGRVPNDSETRNVASTLPIIESWMTSLVEEVRRSYARLSD